MFNVVLADYGAYDAAVAGGGGFNDFDAHLGLLKREHVLDTSGLRKQCEYTYYVLCILGIGP